MVQENNILKMVINMKESTKKENFMAKVQISLGLGEYKWNTGARFKGEFVNGERCGHGIWQSADINGDFYEGEYKEDKKDGYGVYRWSNGSVYEGSFKNDLKHGEGTIKYNNGKIAHLCWKNGEVIKKV